MPIKDAGVINDIKQSSNLVSIWELISRDTEKFQLRDKTFQITQIWIVWWNPIVSNQWKDYWCLFKKLCCQELPQYRMASSIAKTRIGTISRWSHWNFMNIWKNDLNVQIRKVKPCKWKITFKINLSIIPSVAHQPRLSSPLTKSCKHTFDSLTQTSKGTL